MHFYKFQNLIQHTGQLTLSFLIICEFIAVIFFSDIVADLYW